MGDPEVIAALAAVRDSYNMDRLAIVAAVAAIQDEDHHRKIVDHVVAERAWLADRLRELHIDAAPSATNFLFVQPPPGNSGRRRRRRAARAPDPHPPLRS